jgi:putative phage-type endonuclease
MRRVKLEQGSHEWLAWRKKVLTSTDAPMLMGASPYVTPYKGWQRKTGQSGEQKVSPAMLRGQHDEPIAREWFIKEYGIQMEPCCIESDEYNFIGASLDGLSPCGKYMLEIKSNGDHYHYGLNKGLPDFHTMQMQHAYLCTDKTVEKAFYLSWNPSGPIVKEVDPDYIWMENYLPHAREFWRRVVFFDPPPLSEKDYKETDSEDWWNIRISEYQKLVMEEDRIELRKAEIKNELISHGEGQNCRGNGYSLFQKSTRGRVDYEKIPALKDLDLEQFRKPSSLSWILMKGRG